MVAGRGLLLGVASCWAWRASDVSLLPQLFWEKKLSGLNAYDIAEELVRTMELPKGLQGEQLQRTPPPPLRTPSD